LDTGLKIASVSGGMKVNAIPREAEAVVTFNSAADLSAVKTRLADLCKDFAKQYRVDLEISLDTADSVSQVMSANDVQRLVASLLLIPIGVFKMSRDIDGLPDASCNIGVLETLSDGVKISVMPRGSAAHFIRQTEAQINAAAEMMGAEVTFTQRSPAWSYNPDSALLKTAMECYKSVFGREAGITATPGGLECGILVDKIPGLDIIAFGPTSYDVHTPDEGLSIASTEKVWAFLKAILAKL